MSKIKIEICAGTTCFVMGGSSLQDLADLLVEKYGDKVEVKASPCLGMCSQNSEYSAAPYVRVAGEIVSSATVEKVIAEVEKHL